jgi:endogenous inhibitor of DNA gyrase (YacG/DUF329 family)
MPATLRCPICRKQVAFDGPDMPFCSKRCRTADLANWADERYVISTPTHNSEFEAENEEYQGPIR